TNIMGSQATRDSDGVLFTRAGLEIGVAATKTFVAQVAVMCLWALKVAQERRALPEAEVAELVGEVRALPHKLAELLENINGTIDRIAGQWFAANLFLDPPPHVGRP